MPPVKIPSTGTDVLAWDPNLPDDVQEQARLTADLPFVESPLALMADAHKGKGSTVGSVIATNSAIIPAAVGVDIGCGMIAQRFTIRADDVASDELEKMWDDISRTVPAGIPSNAKPGTGSHDPDRPLGSGALEGLVVDQALPDAVNRRKAIQQFGTLGSGNHFVELCRDEDGHLWAVLHSGSRNPGNVIAREHIEKAQNLMKSYFIDLADPDLAYLVEGTEEFDHYISDMRWAQQFAWNNREEMMDQVIEAVSTNCEAANRVGAGHLLDGEPVNCHHNYTTQEHHHGKNMWVTRKGAILARKNVRGVIPGSMATGSFIVSGLGNPSSYESASHGAGRKMSRTKARKNLSARSLDAEMENIVWNGEPNQLLDEHPEAYKDLGEVMDNQRDLVRIEHRLETILNYKGT